MKNRKRIRFGLLFIALALIVMQFVPIDRSVPVVDPSSDFIASNELPEKMKAMVRDACYDCHSYETVYPWYARLAPVSLWMQAHIKDGRKHLNFSIWNTYDAGKKDHKLEELYEMVKEGEMPLDSYTWTHPEGRISDSDRKELADWFNALR